MNHDELKETSVPYRAEEYQSPFASLAEELFRERVLRARQTPPEQKVLSGQRLFEAACEITLAGIRDQFPGVTKDRCWEILCERLALRRKMESNDGQ